MVLTFDAIFIFRACPVGAILSEMQSVISIIIVFSLYGWLLLFRELCTAEDSLKSGQKISSSGNINGSSLVSFGLIFELGFFSPPGSSSTYLGIWYYGVKPQTVVWVANRDSPIVDDGAASFEISEDGNVQVIDRNGKTHWSSNLLEDHGLSSKNRTVRLMDSGNLVLQDDDGGTKVWESFEHPTDTFLAGMRMDRTLKLKSWKAYDDPAKGNFTFQLSQTGEDRYFILNNQSQLYWESRRLDSELIPPTVVLLLSNISLNSSVLGYRNRTFRVESPPIDYQYTRLVMNSTGEIQLLRWDFGNITQGWTMDWKAPKNKCNIYNYCGSFSSCNIDHPRSCRCLPGFKPKNQTLGEESGGCVRKSTSCSKKDIEFLDIRTMKVGDSNKGFAAETEQQCRNECLSTCPLCVAYSYNSSIYSVRASSITCLIWTQDLPTLEEVYHRDGLNLSVPTHQLDRDDYVPQVSQVPSTRKTWSSTNQLPLILKVTFASIISLACAIIFAYVWRKKIAHKQDRRSVQRIQESLYDSERHVRSLIGLQEKDNEGIEVPFFNFETIKAATDNFSDENKLGRGGYGPVYKGRLLGDQEIAVKRLSSVSAQGLQEFKNEVVLIAKLQHRNLVRLQGYCTKEDEKILIYEYMPNKSLDSFLFDRTRTVLLHWKLRFDLILGIARGLLYLHQDSRLRVIHRDLKTSNILLDEEMNPKISDFGLAKVFGGKETQASTQRIVGTYGYMAPEYALDGLFSFKSDVFSFGVVLLEIISGKKNTGFTESHEASTLLGYTWRLWTENKLVDLMDPCLRENCNENQLIRCANVGLLCVQDEPSDRPSMSNVVILLESEIATIPTPNKPTFFASRGLSSTVYSTKPEMSLQIDSSYFVGR